MSVKAVQSRKINKEMKEKQRSGWPQLTQLQWATTDGTMFFYNPLRLLGLYDLKKGAKNSLKK